MKNGTSGPNLGEFIESTLLQIIEGVRRAQDKEAVRPDWPDQSKAKIHPGAGYRRLDLVMGYVDTPEGGHLPILPVAFDVAVTAERELKKGIAGGVRISVISAGGDHDSSVRQSTVSRIRFQVPVVLPHGH